MPDKNDQSDCTEEETQRRFLATVKAVLNTPPKPHKSMPRKGVAAQRKKGRKKTRATA